jgi:endonuclease YncB( thermonuclease family)
MRAIWKVRILGIDTPEMGTVEGSKAKIEAQAFAESKDGAMVFEQSIEDSFGRMLVDVEIAGERWSRHMLSTGNARPYDGR